MRKLKRILLILLAALVLTLAVVSCQITQPVLNGKRAQSMAQVDPIRLEAHVRMLSEALFPRDYTHPENLDLAAAYIGAEFAEFRGRIQEQVYEVDGIQYRNVILKLGPDTNERIVVGAHYDAAGQMPGADDNASGVAGLIELARLLDTASLPLTVELVAYTLEEPPFFRTANMGSAVHARSLKEQGVEVRAMLCLEMIGYFSDEPDSQGFPLSLMKIFYPSEGNWIALVGDMRSGGAVRRWKKAFKGGTDLPVYSINAPPKLVPGIDWSDHLSYRMNGYPGIMITDTAYLRNTYYHSDFDTADRLDYGRMAKVVAGVHAGVLDLAGGKESE